MSSESPTVALLRVFVSSAPSLVAAFVLAVLGAGLGVGLSLLAGILLAGLGGVFLTPFLRRYMGLLKDGMPTGFQFMRVLFVLALPINVAAFALSGVPEAFDLVVKTPAEAVETVALLGWSGGGVLALTAALAWPGKALREPR